MHGEASAEARRFPPRSSSGAQIRATLEPRRRFDSFLCYFNRVNSRNRQSRLSACATHTGPDHDRDVGRSSGQTAASPGHHSADSGLREAPHSECRSQHALSLLVPQGTTAPAKQGQEPGDQGGAAHVGQYSQDHDGRSRCNSEIPLHDEAAELRSDQDHSLSLDGQEPHQRRKMAPFAQSVLSTACGNFGATDIAGQTQQRSGLAKQVQKDAVDDGEKMIVRILFNPTGTICFANALLTALAWSTLLSGGLLPGCWQHDFAFMRCFTQWTFLPLDLLTCEPFKWLLFGDWDVNDLMTQQDIIDFCHFLLLRRRPSFLSCSWMTPHTPSSCGRQSALER